MPKLEKTTPWVLALTSIAVLAYELTQIRIFAFSLHPAVAYSAIALAMLGFGLGATMLALWPALHKGDPLRRIAWLSLLLAVAIVLVNILFARASERIIPPDTVEVDVFWIVVVLVPCIVPYFLGGLIIAMILEAGMALIGRLYFWNLTGSAVGCIAMILLLRPLGAERLVLLTAALAAGGGLVLAIGTGGAVRWLAAAGALAALCMIPVAQKVFPFKPDLNGFNQVFERKEQALGFPAPVNEVTEWDPIGRIDIQKHTRSHIYVSEPIGFRVVTIDGGAMTLMLEEAGEPGEWGRALFTETMYSSVYRIKKRPDVLVIGVGGGSDIEAALYWKARSVTGVEISYSTLRAVTGRYADFVGWPRRKRVTTVHGDGRSYAKSTKKRFDVIQLSGVDTMTNHTALSSMIAAEDYLYTVEAFTDFLKILKKDGILSVMRFGTQALNLSTIAAIALREMGIERPERHLMALAQTNISGVLVKRTPFKRSEIKTLEEFTTRRWEKTDISIPIYDRANVKLGAPVALLYPRSAKVAPRYVEFFDAVARGEEKEALEKLDNALVIPTDDKPYYILGTYMKTMTKHGKAHPALALLLTTTAVIAVAALALVILPAFSVRRRSKVGFGTLLGVVAYFFAIGAGFMLLEVGLIHKATVFVSTPGAAVAVVISAIMISSGIGARVSDSVRWSLAGKVLFALACLVGVSALYRLGIGALFELLYGLPVWARCVIAAITIAPAGFFTGWFFPVGLRVAGASSEALVPWAIAVNGFASVIGSLATLFLGLTVGLTGVFVVALVCYIVAAVAIQPVARGIKGEVA